jgi:hypothetical protein
MNSTPSYVRGSTWSSPRYLGQFRLRRDSANTRVEVTARSGRETASYRIVFLQSKGRLSGTYFPHSDTLSLEQRAVPCMQRYSVLWLPPSILRECHLYQLRHLDWREAKDQFRADRNRAERTGWGSTVRAFRGGPEEVDFMLSAERGRFDGHGLAGGVEGCFMVERRRTCQQM